MKVLKYKQLKQRSIHITGDGASESTVQSFSRIGVLSFMFEDLSRCEVEVFVADVTVVNPGQAGR